MSRIPSFRISVLLLGAFLAAAPATAQAPRPVTDPASRLEGYRRHEAMKEASLFRNHPWRFLGPTNVSGRMTDVDAVGPKGKSYTIFVAGASGGVWRSVNEGVTWEPVFQDAASTSIGDVTIAPSDPDIVWVGTGEANIFRSSMAGAGVYRSTDGGNTWRYMGLAGTHTIARIVIHPTNPDIVYVAASGREWTENEERGVYRTTDGGETWEKVLYVNPRTGAIDLVMDPSDPETLYAATWERIRLKWNDPRNEPEYTGSAIYKSTDGGDTWREITEGLPEPRHRGRIGIDIARSNPRVLYAFIDNYETARPAPEGATDAYGRPRGPVIRGATVFRTDDAGEHWRRVSEYDPYMETLSATYGWVFGQVRVDPNDEDRIYVMGLALNLSEDGGRTFRPLRGMHGDHHGLWIDPANSAYLANVNDGGLAISYDGGKNWRTFADVLPLAQFFDVAYDMDTPFHVYGSIQDHGSRRGVVDLSRGRHRIPAVDFEDAPGGEGSSHAIDPTDPNIVYSAGFYGRITRTDLRTGESKLLVPRAPEGEPPYRGQWLAPFILSPHNPRIVYLGMNHLFRSLDRGDTWERISPDLSFADPDRLGDIPFQTIFTISESPLKFGLIYAGTDDGRAWVTRDYGLKWTEVTPRETRGKWISRMVASAFDTGTVYMAQNGKRDDDFAPYVWKSTDYGETWVSIVNDLPLGPVNVIREDPKNPDVLYVGTDLGVYVSLDGGAHWEVLAADFPTTFVHDLVIHPRDDILVAATHGRGMWAMDVRPLQALTREVLESDLHVFEPEPARLPAGYRRPGATAYVEYFVGRPAGEARIVIRDASGTVVRELTGTADRGLNGVEWDLREAVAPGEEGEMRRGAPLVRPGTYTVTVTVGSRSVETTLEVNRGG